MRRKGIYIILLVALAAGGCKLNDKQWDINMLVPVANADLTIANLVNDTTLKQNPDSSLYLVNVQPLKSLNISSLLAVPDTDFENTVSLKTITLGHRTLTHNITLGQVARSPALGVGGQILIAEQGRKLPIQPIDSVSLGETPINAQSLFTSAVFIGGTLELDIHNGFPVAITNVHFQLLNQSDNAVIIDDTIKNLPSGGFIPKYYPLAGKTLSGNLLLNILNMSSPGSADSVLIDTSDAIYMVLSGSDMQVSSATAVFPAQNLINDSVDVSYNLRGPLFKSFLIRSGEIHFKTTSSIHDTTHLSYQIPGATKDGQSINESLIVPPAGNSSVTVNDSFPLNGYQVDLTGQNHNATNTFYNIVQARIDSTGKLESLSLSDSIYINYGLFHVIPEYAVGYLGTATYTVGPQTTSLDFFQNFSANKVTIPHLNVTLQIKNGIGAPVSGTIRSITAFNSKTNQSLPLTCKQWINVPINIPAAKDTFSQSIVNLPLDNTNSNIGDLLAILPDKLLYLFDYTIDPKGNSSNFNDFIYYGSTVSASLNIQLPLEVGLDGLTLEDTIIPNITSNVDLGSVQDGTLHLTTTNGFPLSAKMQLYILDDANKITDSFFAAANNTVPAGNAGNTVPGIGTLNLYLTQSQWREIADNKHLILKATLNTTEKKVVKIYSNAHFKAKLTANFRYRNSTN